MRFFALVTMLFCWMIYSTMAAWAGCPTCLSMDRTVSMEAESMHHDMGGMAMAGMAGKADPAKDPCSTTGMAHTPFCAACLILPPVLVIDTSAKPAYGYPTPEPAKALNDNRPAPLSPPPRTV
jgi:hypothetical protein